MAYSDFDPEESENYCNGSMGMSTAECGSSAYHFEHWIGNDASTGGGPTDAERQEHFGSSGPHQRGECRPVCTFGDW